MTRAELETWQDRLAETGPAELVFLAQMALEGDQEAWDACAFLKELA